MKKAIKNVFILTQDANFFYRINKRLKNLAIPFKILSFQDKIPNIPCLILITLEEFKENQISKDKEGKFLTYDKAENLDEYLVRILAFYRIGKGFFSELTFSIDPGTKKIGLVVILDNYYINSHTFYDKNPLIKKLEQYYNALQKDNPNNLKIIFKFGMGVLSLTQILVEEIFSNFKNNKNISILLIDESKSSKIKIPDKSIKISKHETSALILCLRNGIELNRDNYSSIFNLIKQKKIKKSKFDNEWTLKNDGMLEELGNMAKKIVNGEQSISLTCELIKNMKELKKLE